MSAERQARFRGEAGAYVMRNPWDGGSARLLAHERLGQAVRSVGRPGDPLRGEADVVD